MVIELIKRGGRAVFFICQKWTPVRGAVLVALFSTLAGLAVNFPDYQHNLDVLGLSHCSPSHAVWQQATMQVITEQIAHPLERNSAARDITGSHTEKLAYRLSMPVVGHVLGLSLGQLILLQQLCGVLFLGLVSVIAHRATGDTVCATLLPVGFAFCYPGQACFRDLQPFFDGMAFFALAVAMLIRNPLPVFLGVTFACWTDERAVLVAPLVALWWALQNGTRIVNWTSRASLARNPAVWAVVAAVATYGIGRIWLGHVWDIRQTHSDISFGVARSQWPIFLVGLASGLKWFWVLLVLGAFSGFLAGTRRLAGVFAAAVLCYAAACSTIYDTTRSAAYVFPAVFVSLTWLSRSERPEALRWIVLAVAVLCILTPSPFIIGNGIEFAAPILPMALKWLF
jgi:hypothetical protein